MSPASLLCATLIAVTLVAQPTHQRPRILGVAHIAVNTDNPDAARKFYGQYLGYAEVFTEDRAPAITFKVNDRQYIEVLPGWKGLGQLVLARIAFETENAQQLRDYLAAKNVSVPAILSKDPDGNLSFTIKDPDDHDIKFVQYLPGSIHFRNFGKFLPATRVSERIIHVGTTVSDRAAFDKLYRDILGFKEFWHGGMTDERTDWIDMRVPDGTDWFEYMLNVRNPSARTLGVMNHMALGVPDIQAGFKTVTDRGLITNEKPKIGRDGKWQLNLYDPNLTRAELMEPKPVEKPCCSPMLDAQAALPPLPAPLNIPKPAPATDAPYGPQPILPGGVVVPLYPAGSPLLKADRIKEPEQYNLSQTVPGRINSIVNIHNPSIEFHPVDRSLNTGAAVILIAGGGHNTLNVGSESADFVPFFYNYGVNTVILRNRLRRDGYTPQTDAVNDTLQAIRLIRAYAKEWNLDPGKIGVMGFSAGAELAAAAAVLYNDFDSKNSSTGDAFSAITSRPDFAGIIYPGPSPFARNRTPPPIPRNVPPAFITSGGSGDRGHAIWAMDYYSAMLNLGVPNIEMHLYGNGRHPGDQLSDGGRQTGGLTDRNDTPFGTWQFRFIDWFRDLGFLQKPGVPTKAATDSATFANKQP